MHQISDAWLAHQRARFTRCDAERYRRFDPRFQRGHSPFEDKAWADQPRVPAGSSEGGQWTSEGEGSVSRILSDATPDGVKPGAQLAQYRPPIRGPVPGATPGQNARLVAAELRAEAAITRVREIDRTWRPTETSLTAPNSVEGYVARAEARTEQAEARLRELAQLPHARLLEIYREQNAPWSKNNVVAVCTPDQQPFFGVNPSAPTRTEADSLRQQRTFEAMINESPNVLRRGSIDWWPNYALNHAESNILLRMAEANRGTLAGRTLEITVDNPMCRTCERVLPSLGMHLGNPRVLWFHDFRLQGIMYDRVLRKP